jgi:hypothetical protein
MSVQRVEESSIRAEIPSRDQPDALVNGADKQSVLDVFEITTAVEEFEEVLALQPLDSRYRRFIRKEFSRVFAR